MLYSKRTNDPVRKSNVFYTNSPEKHNPQNHCLTRCRILSTRIRLYDSTGKNVPNPFDRQTIYFFRKIKTYVDVHSYFRPFPSKRVTVCNGRWTSRVNSSSPRAVSDLQLTPEMYNQLRVLQKKAKDLRQEARNLRRMSQAQAHSIRETIKDTFIKIR